jgi:hypothetical protein
MYEEIKIMGKTLLLSLAIALIGGILFSRFSKMDEWESNATAFRKNILLIGKGTDTITIRDITPFEWDRFYSFYPYTSKKKIYAVVGYKWDNITEAMSEGVIQIVFMKDEKVLCYLYGLPSNIKYSISLAQDEYKDGVAFLNSNEDVIFKVRRSDGIVYLEQVK